MKKVLLGVGGAQAVGVAGLCAAAAVQPDTVHVERQARVQASAADVFPHLSDLRRFAAWSPWSGMDPAQQVTFSEPSGGVGARYAWAGNDQVGVGSLVITAVDEGRSVTQQLAFTAPWATQAVVTFQVAPAAQGVTVTWTYDSPADFGTRLMGLFLPMDDLLGPDYEKGLAQLTAIVEAEVAARHAEEARAAAAAAAEGAAAAPAPPAGG